MKINQLKMKYIYLHTKVLDRFSFLPDHPVEKLNRKNIFNSKSKQKHTDAPKTKNKCELGHPTADPIRVNSERIRL